MGNRKFNAEELKQLQGQELEQKIEEFDILLRSCYRKDTAYPSCQAEWVWDDPTYGHCAVAAMLFNDYFGGTIHKIRVSGGGTHYFNRLNGEYYDLTREQFDLYNIPLKHEPNEEIPRYYCGKNPDTKKRYDLLKVRLEEAISRE